MSKIARVCFGSGSSFFVGMLLGGLCGGGVVVVPYKTVEALV